MTPLERFLAALTERNCDPKRNGNGWSSRCPAHDDSNPSLSISERTLGGSVLIHCHAGCENKNVLDAMQLEFKDLFPQPSRSRKQARKIVAEYDYCDEAGNIKFQVVRYKPKHFQHRRPDGKGGWVWNMKGVRIIPYRLPELIKADPNSTIHICEGEQDVDRLLALGSEATCNAGGAGKWKDKHSTFVKDRHVAIVPDNDNAGREHAEKVAKSLQGVAASVRIVELPGLPDKGDVSDWIEGGGTKEQLERLVAETPIWEPKQGDTSTEAKASSDPRIHIEVTPDEHIVIEKAVAALANDKQLYVRGGVLVKVVDQIGIEAGIRRSQHTPHLRAMDTPNVREALSRQVYFYTAHSSGDEVQISQAHPPSWCCNAIVSRGKWPGVPAISGITSVPVLRSDGTVLDVPGFDASSGLLYVPFGEFPQVPESPSVEDGKNAAHRLLELVSDFPFASEEHRSAWLAALLTPLARHAFEGPAPMFLFDANTRGSGKTLLSDINGEIAMGRSLPRMTCPRDDEESRKRITALAIAGDPMILLDNIAGSLGSASLDAALTGTTWEDRLLGKSQIVRMPLTAVWYATGNNVAIRADTSRRIVFVRLESPEEYPEERTGFRFPDLLSHVREHRAEYLADALTCLRAFIVAGKPASSTTPFGSFEGWSRIVRECICWLGLPDPLATRKELTTRNDRSADQLAGLIAGLEQADPNRNGLTSADIIMLVEGGTKDHEVLRAAVLDACDSGRKVSARQLGNLLGKIRGRVCAGRAIDCRKPGGIAKWFVRPVTSKRPETEPPEQHEQHEQPELQLSATPCDNGCCSSGSGCLDSSPEKSGSRMQVTI